MWKGDTNLTKEGSFSTIHCSNCKHSLNLMHKRIATEVTKIWSKYLTLLQYASTSIDRSHTELELSQHCLVARASDHWDLQLQSRKKWESAQHPALCCCVIMRKFLHMSSKLSHKLICVTILLLAMTIYMWKQTSKLWLTHQMYKVLVILCVKHTHSKASAPSTLCILGERGWWSQWWRVAASFAASRSCLKVRVHRTKSVTATPFKKRWISFLGRVNFVSGNVGNSNSY